MPLYKIPERFPTRWAGCLFGVPIDFPEFRPDPVLLPESFCVPFGSASGGLSRDPSYGLHKALEGLFTKENKVNALSVWNIPASGFVFFILHTRLAKCNPIGQIQTNEKQFDSFIREREKNKRRKTLNYKAKWKNTKNKQSKMAKVT